MHATFAIGCIISFVILMFVDRVSKDGKYRMADRTVYNLAQRGSLVTFAFWFTTSILRLGVFYGWLVSHMLMFIFIGKHAFGVRSL